MISACKEILSLVSLEPESDLDLPGILSPASDRRTLAIRDPAQPYAPCCTVRRFSACLPPSMQRRQKGQMFSTPSEQLLAVCWSPDSSRIMVATGSGALYLMDR